MIKDFFFKNTPKQSRIIGIVIFLIMAIIVIGCMLYNNGLNKEIHTVASIEKGFDKLVEERIQIQEEKERQVAEEEISTEGPFYIKVNCEAQVVTIYSQDEVGNYTKPVKAMICSTGTHTPTTGIYKIPARWEWLGLQGDVYGRYATQIKGNILFHSVPYLRKWDNASLEYWEYDKLGEFASAGCVRLTIADAKWIFDNCSNGTSVEFYESSDPGPLGKPIVQKISNAEEKLRNWDPTDPDETNPWKNLSKEMKDNIGNENEN